MNNTLRLVLVIGLLIYFFAVYKLLKKKKLALKYSLLWLFVGAVMLVLVIFPDLLLIVCGLFGIAEEMNGLFTFAIGFILMLLMSLSVIVSKQSERIKNLVQDNALLEKRIRELENHQRQN